MVLTLWARMNQGVMAMKGNATLPKSSELESHHQMQFSIILKILVIQVSKVVINLF